MRTKELDIFVPFDLARRGQGMVYTDVGDVNDITRFYRTTINVPVPDKAISSYNVENAIANVLNGEVDYDIIVRLREELGLEND